MDDEVWLREIVVEIEIETEFHPCDDKYYFLCELCGMWLFTIDGDLCSSNCQVVLSV